MATNTRSDIEIERVKVKIFRPRDRQSVSLHPVYYDFRIGPFRLKGNGRAWRELEEEAEITGISFERFLPFLSRPRRDLLEKLQDYAQRDPASFSREVYRSARAAAAGALPKHRGGSPYRYSSPEMDKIQTTSKHLYVWLQYWIRKPRDGRPEKLQSLLGRLRLSRSTDAKDITRKIMKAHYPELPEADGVPENYYRHFIVGDRDLKAVKAYHKATNYRPDTPIYQSLHGTISTMDDLLTLP